MKVKYIGTCIKTDSIAGAGLRWEPNQVRDVSPELAEKLLSFTDTWQQTGPVGKEQRGLEHVDDDPENPLTQPVGLLEEEKQTEVALPLVDYHAMDKKTMAEYAQDNHGVKLDPKSTAADMRQELIGLDSNANLGDVK